MVSYGILCGLCLVCVCIPVRVCLSLFAFCHFPLLSSNYIPTKGNS